MFLGRLSLPSSPTKALPPPHQRRYSGDPCHHPVEAYVIPRRPRPSQRWKHGEEVAFVSTQSSNFGLIRAAINHD